MRLNQVIVCYYSPTHTSKKIAQSIADGLDISRRRDIDLTNDKCTETIHIENAICIVAVPVYGGLIAPVAAQRIQRLKAENSLVVPIVVYGNRDYEDALVQLRDLLTANSFVPLCGGAFIGEHSYSRPGMPIAEGRPDSTDLQTAKDFGVKILEKTLSQLHINDIPDSASPDFALTYDTSLESLITPPAMKGNIPYKTLRPATPQAPIVTDDCYGCGECLNLCPTGAISLNNERSETAIERCTKCCACVKYCPVSARVFDTPYTAMLHEKCAERREPELFI